MFIVNNSQCLNINTDVSDQDLNYELSIPQKSQPFVWSENLDYFLETCQDAINSFIDDCKEDSFEDLDEINLGYLYTLNLPRANFLAKQHPDLFCHLMNFAHNLFIFPPFFYHRERLVISEKTFLINPITNIYIKDNQIVMEGFGYFIKDRDDCFYTSIQDFLNKENIYIECRSTKTSK